MLMLQNCVCFVSILTPDEEGNAVGEMGLV